MFCVNCGKELQENAQFCEGCGTSYAVSSAVGAEAAPAQPANSAPQQIVNNFYQETKQPISVWGWIGRSLFLLIPIAGAIVYFIMLFVWANDKSKEVSFNNWAKAQLWVLLVAACVVATIVLIAFAGVSSVLR